MAQAKYFAFAASVLLIAVLGTLGSLALSTNYNDCVGHSGEHATGQTDQKGSPIVEPAIDDPTPVSLFVYCGGIFANENGSGITALATVLLTVVTGLLGYLAWDQGRATRAQLRAYLGISETMISNFVAGGVPKVHGLLKNAGQTPARKVTTVYSVGYFPYPLTVPLVAPPYEGELPKSVISSGGTISLDVSFSTPIAQAHIDAVHAHTGAVYFWGVITYEDIFGRERIHKFRYKFGGLGDLAANFALSVCEHGNEDT